MLYVIPNFQGLHYGHWISGARCRHHAGPLWFGLAASAVAWVSLGIYGHCHHVGRVLHQEQFGNASYHPGARAAYIAVATGAARHRRRRRNSLVSQLARHLGSE